MESGTRHERVDGWVEPARAFEALFAHVAYSFWLDRGDAGVSVMGEAGPGASIVTASVGTGLLTRSDQQGNVVGTLDESIFDFLRGQMNRGQMHAAAGASPAAPFTAGWFGWLGYELGVDASGVPSAPSRHPDAGLMFADRAVTFDRRSRTVTVSAPGTPEAAAWMAETCARLDALHGGHPPARPLAIDDAATGAWRHDDTAYLRMVRECQAAIVRGDAYLLCLTNELRIPVRVEPLAAYLALRDVSPTAHGGLIRFGALSLLSASPESFLQVGADGLMTTRPVKGTRPRGVDPVDDERIRAELLASDKERAENLMIVDLMRNDLGRVARLGSVEVGRLLEVETYAPVHQLVSTVRAQLADGLDAIDAVRSCFPAGSMTGTPKRSAMRILHELEGGPRGIYSGCFGLFSVDGSVDVSMVIRSIVLDGSGASIGAGGGITSLSVPEDELAEVKLKAAVLAEVVRASALH